MNFLYDGEYEAAVHGLVPAEIISATVPVGADFNSNLHRLEISDVAAFRVALPLGTTSADFIDLDLVSIVSSDLPCLGLFCIILLKPVTNK